MFLPEDKSKEYQMWKTISSTVLHIGMREFEMELVVNPKKIKQKYV